MKSRLIRLLIVFGALVVGAIPAALESVEFRTFVADHPYWVVIGPVIVSVVQQGAAYLIQRAGKANPVSESPTA